MIKISSAQIGSINLEDKGKTLLQWAKKNLPVEAINEQTKFTILLSRKGIEHTIAEKFNKPLKRTMANKKFMATVLILPQILEQMMVMERKEDKKKDPNILAVWVYRAKVKVEDELFEVKVLVKEVLHKKTESYHTYYDHQYLLESITPVP